MGKSLKGKVKVVKGEDDEWQRSVKGGQGNQGFGEQMHVKVCMESWVTVKEEASLKL